MLKKSFIVLVSMMFITSSSSCMFAGEIKNLNINSTNGSKIEVKSRKNSKIENIKIKKDSKSKVIINNKEVNCDDPENKGICKP